MIKVLMSIFVVYLAKPIMYLAICCVSKFFKSFYKLVMYLVFFVVYLAKPMNKYHFLKINIDDHLRITLRTICHIISLQFIYKLELSLSQ